MTTREWISAHRAILQNCYGRTNAWWSNRETLRAARGWFKPEAWRGFTRARRKAIFREVLKFKRGDLKFHSQFRI